MKPKECAKYVYKPYPVKYYETSRCTWLDDDFKFLENLFRFFSVYKVQFYHHGNKAMAWRDKHNNIVVRVHHADTQCKINF